MAKIRKCLSVLLAVLLLVGIMIVPTYAASASQNGLEVSWTTNKEKYAYNEQIIATLTVTNTNYFPVYDVSLEALIPQELVLVEHSEAVKQVDVLEPGQTVELTVTFSANESAWPSDPSNPTTGDGNLIFLWAVVTGATVCALLILIDKNKKLNRVLSMVLCFTILASLVNGEMIRAHATEADEVTVDVSVQIKVSDKDVTLNAVVSYAVEEDNGLTRGQWIQQLITAYGYPTNVEGELNSYSDIADSEYRDYIEAAIVYSILFPENGEQFCPDEAATREFVAATAVYSMGYHSTTPISCEDAEDIDDKLAAQQAIESGLLSLENGYYYPDRPARQTEAEHILTVVEEVFNTADEKEETVDGFVFYDNVNVQPKGTEWEAEGERLIVPEGEEAPAVGQIIVFGTETAIRVETVEKTDGQTLITYSTPELHEYLDYMNLEGEAVMDFGLFVPAEGVTVSYNSAAPQTYGFMDDWFDVDAGNINLNTDVTLSGDVDLGDGWEIGYEVTVAIPKVGYKFDVDFDFVPFSGDPLVNVKNAYVKFEEDVNVHVDFGRGIDTSDEEFDDSVFDDVLEKEIPLGSIPLIGVDGLCVEVELDLVLTAEGKITFDYNVYGTIGAQVLDNRARNISALQSSTSVGLEAAASAGVEIELEAEVFGEDIFGFGAEAGVKGAGSVNVRDTGLVCMDATVHVFAELTAFEECLIDDWLDIAVGYTIWDEDNSPVQISGHWENLERVDDCTYESGTIKGTVASAENRNEFIEGACIAIYEHTELEHECTVYSDVNGSYVAVVDGNTYLVRISADGYIPFESLETVGNNQLIYLETYLLVEGTENSGEEGKIGGGITNSVTGAGIPNATLTIRKGWNMLTGEVVTTVQTDSSGNYSVRLPLGNYTIQMESEGYVSNHINVAVTRTDNENCHGVLTPDGTSSIPLGDMRIVMTWTEEPSDLDSHLWGPTTNGTSSYHIFYSDMEYYANGSRHAYLDRDDTTYDGPETTTVYSMTANGVYSFYVHDFTNRYNSNSTVLANSGAKVQVYMGETLIGQYHVPSSGVGTVWHVFDFDATQGKLISVNTFSSESDPDYVGDKDLYRVAIYSEVDEKGVVGD